MTRYQEFREYPVSNPARADMDDFMHWSSGEADHAAASAPMPYLLAEAFDNPEQD
jgi:hypothetical protein